MTFFVSKSHNYQVQIEITRLFLLGMLVYKKLVSLL